MREKNLVILCVIFAVLLGLTFFKSSMKKPQVASSVEEEVSHIIVPALKRNDLTEIIIRLGDGQSEDPEKPKNVQLAKEGDHWVVKTRYDVRARDQVITTLLDKLDGLTGELRSDNKDILADYGIDDQEAVHVQLHQQGSDYTDIAVGTKKAGYQNNFVRLGDSGAVYIVNQDLLSVLGVRGEGEEQKLDPNTWLDKRIAHIDSSQVTGVLIKEMQGGSEKTAIDLTREEVDGNKKWTSAIPYNINISASKIKSMVDLFNNTYAQEVVAPDVAGAFDAIEWSAAFTLEDGQQVKLVRGQEQEGQKYYLRQEGAPYYFQLAKSTFNSRESRQGAIFADNPLEVNEGKISEIEVRDLSNKKVFQATKKETEKVPENAEGDENAKPEKEITWVTPSGGTVETSKVNAVANKIKAIALETVLQPQISLEDALTVRFVQEGKTVEFKVSKDIKLDTNKQCSFVTIGAAPQSYCAAKSAITALQNALP